MTFGYEVLGWIGASAFALCALPQAIKVYVDKDASGLSWLFLILWATGEVLTWTYVIIHNILNDLFQLPLHLNYFFNFIILIYLMYGKVVYKNMRKLNE